ncbi:hypothetical protein CAOG_05365 [Capsaspora owczarzaki ATCC 30864]|uniref:Uncharacterized protein n=1 Tax=Capsaspora owczarzaki (strain ATCC 30864) TaxID=595528 RepID=A0A0D2WT64_CAPO3|nr:hypothetical protein CAOG_05365 [Capsaspora owczarzaki ATCC 30864]KJE94783.1 hypothetical protein CAOG_005365 [Capsaspora owczarzaki ATCC 30864]|eukprot:XP_004347050.1 hypothetical protein CAOG_05365 [Capsaspora owczarzaki ATCC 30864]
MSFWSSESLSEATKFRERIAAEGTGWINAARGKTPLMRLCKCDTYLDVDAIEVLVENGADCVAMDDYGDTPLLTMIQRFDDGRPDLVASNLKVVKCMIEKGNAPLQRPEDNPDTVGPLFVAAEYGRTEIMAYLIQRGANVDAPEFKAECAEDLEVPPKCTPLHGAVEQEQLESVKVLIAAGAKLNEKDKEGRTPLAIALSRRHAAEIAQVLRAAGALEN